jgi:hypothetical protein
MRLRLLAEEGVFDLDLDSSRCVHLAGGGHCCGRISDCPHIETPEQCIRSGGTVFTVRFPWQEPPGEEEPSGAGGEAGS